FPVPWIVGFVLAYALVHEAATRLGCAVALQAAAASATSRPGLGPLDRVLVDARHVTGARRRAAARWLRAPAALAMWMDDLRIARRVPATRRRAATAAISVALACAAWRLPIEPPLSPPPAFALSPGGAAPPPPRLI